MNSGFALRALVTSAIGSAFLMGNAHRAFAATGYAPVALDMGIIADARPHPLALPPWRATPHFSSPNKTLFRYSAILASKGRQKVETHALVMEDWKTRRY